MPQPMHNLEYSSYPITAMNKALALIAKAFKINTIPINNNQRKFLLIPRNNQIAQLMMNTRPPKTFKCKRCDDNEGNQYGNGNVVTTSAEGNGNGINGNPIRCYNCRGEGHYASNCIMHMHKKPKRVKVNRTSEDTLQQASTSETQSDNALVYDSDGSTEVPKDENCYDHDIFNMLNHQVQYTDLQTELDRTKEKLENCIIKKEKEYAVLWNNWYTKCKECKYDKISYDKAYNDMQQKIERLQDQLGDLKGKSSDTQCASNTLDPVSQKLKDKNVSLEFKVQNYAKENEHLKTTYKNLFDSIKVTHAHNNSIIDSLQRQLYDTIYENAKLRAQLFNKVSEPKGTTKGTRTNTMFTKQSILGKPPSSSYKPKLYSVTPFPKSLVLPKVDKTNALSKPVTSNSAPFIRESKVVQTVNEIAPRIFRTNPSKTSRVDNVVPNKPVKTSVRIKPITVSQPNVIHKQQANSDSNGFSSTRVNNTAKTRRPHPRSNSNTDRVPSKCKSSFLSNNVEKIEENHRNSQIPKNQKHMLSEFTTNHDVCVLNYVNDMNSCVDNQSANVTISENQKKYKENAKNSKELGSKGSLASSRPSKPRTCPRWIPTRRIFAMSGKLNASSNTENKSEKSVCDNASTSNPSKPSSKGFPISTSLLGRLSRLRKQHTSIYPIVVYLIFSNGL
ncbi:reverse transcriptase domain-containing protein [Tanacetum coccineum]